MGTYGPGGEFRAGRRSKFHCSTCARVFEYGFVPVPDHEGKRICRDCRIAAMGAESMKGGRA